MNVKKIYNCELCSVLFYIKYSGFYQGDQKSIAFVLLKIMLSGIDLYDLKKYLHLIYNNDNYGWVHKEH